MIDGMYKYFTPKIGKSEILDKSKSVSQYVNYMLARTQSMFKYENLPDTIPQRMLELYLQTNGFAIWAKYNDNLYVFNGGLGGEPDVYYRPTVAVVANPALNMSKDYKIGEDCVLMYSDSLRQGLIPMFERYAIQLSENDITIRVADINIRLINLLSATDDKTRNAAIEYLREIEKGNLGVVAENAFLGGIKLQSPAGVNSNYISQLLELQQYLKSGWYTELGLQSNYNMKRESLNTAETKMDREILLPLVDDMLNCRQKAVEEVNNMFGTNISVDFNSAWKDRDETEISDNRNESEVKEDDGQSNNPESSVS